jgi:penicillin-binding protein 2
MHGKRGTAKKSAIGLPFKTAGKTGTAQVFGIKQDEKYDAKTLEKKLHDHALFIAFAPAEKPELVIAVVVENGGGGSKTAAPIARKMIDYYFKVPQLEDEQPTQ